MMTNNAPMVGVAVDEAHNVLLDEHELSVKTDFVLFGGKWKINHTPCLSSIEWLH